MRADAYLASLQQASFAAIGVEPESRHAVEGLNEVSSLLWILAQSAPLLDPARYAEFRATTCEELGRRREGRRPWKLHTSFDDLLAPIAADVVALAREVCEEPGLDPACGSLPLGQLEGLVIAVPDEPLTQIVVTDEWFPTYANLLAKVLAHILVGLDAGEADSLLLGSPVVSRFLEMMLATLNGRPSDAPQYYPDQEPTYLRLVQALRTAIEAFVLARLVAHVALDHHGRAPLFPVSLPGATVHARRFEQGQVTEADAAALLITLRLPALDGAGAFAVAAVDVFLATLAMLDAARALQASESEPVPEPSAVDWLTSEEGAEPTYYDARRTALREYLRQLESEPLHDTGPGESAPERVTEWLDQLDEVPRTLWGHLKTVLEAQ
jgi:hypothetical protein